MDFLADPQVWISLLTLASLEIVLGIDNVIFISILAGKLPLIGVSLLAEGLHQHIPKGYIYFSMAFSCGVEFMNLKMRARSQPPVTLRETIK